MHVALRIALTGVCLLAPAPAFASQGLDGAHMTPLWAAPFSGVLLSIALGPLVAPALWHHHYGKVAAFWALSLLAPLALWFGPGLALNILAHALVDEFIPFIVVLFALFTIAGGLRLRGALPGSPLVNGAMLLAGSALASVIGTTGASMVLVRPLIRANVQRRHNGHVMVFFIFLVSNIGGALSPLGDPPLFLGFLRGVDFFWTTRNLWRETLVCVGALILLFVALDYAWSDRGAAAAPDVAREPVRLEGLVNLPLLALVIAAILACAAWRSDMAFDVAGAKIALPDLVRDGALIALALASLWLTPRGTRAGNGFEWEPILEVAKLFASIFICIAPVLAMLDAEREGPFAPLVALVTRADGQPSPLAYFWACGLLSSLLDNAPTYLVFFELAGGDPARLMGPLSQTLAAISMGAVFMGANTYVGNAPNFMVYAIARRNGVNMPGFFGYMLWSGVVLLPLFAAVGWLFLG